MNGVRCVRCVMSVLAVIGLSVSVYAFPFHLTSLRTGERGVLLFVGACSALLLGRYWYLRRNPES